jgi:hypothetical protein
MGPSADIVTGYGLEDLVGVRVPVKQEFSLLRVVQTGFGVKRPGLEAEYHQSVLRSRKYGSIHPLPHTSSWRSA